MTARRLEIFVIIVIIAVIGIVYAFKQNPVSAPTIAVNDSPSSALSAPDSSAMQADETQAKLQVPTSVITYQGVDGKNAFDLLKAKHTVEAKHYSFGDLVTSIDGIAPDANHFWAMYVNGEFSQIGASAYQTKSTDTIKWQMDTVVN